MITFSFTRHFTTGILKGIAHTDTVTFESVARFEEWKRGVNANNKKGAVDYYVD